MPRKFYRESHWEIIWRIWKRGVSITRLRKASDFFSGYAGWSPSQLDDEVSKGAWLIHPASKELIFDHPPQSLWRDIMSQMGWEERLQATAPDDLSEN